MASYAPMLRPSARASTSPIAALFGLAIACTLGVAGCSGRTLPNYAEKPRIDIVLEPFGLTTEVPETAIASLAWFAPDEKCAHAFRIDVEYEPDLKFESDNTAGLSLRRHERRKPYRLQDRERTKKREVDLPGGPIPNGVVVPAQLFYQGLRAERTGTGRDVYFSSEVAGPSSPLAGCFWRTWDPIDDALALAWPKLPGRMTAVGETWKGGRIEAKCSRSACVDPKTGGGGPGNHHRACVTPPWSETLSGVLEIGGERYAVVRSEWDDGHDGEGISSTRVALISVTYGRPVWTQTVVNHRFSQPTAQDTWSPIVRTWTATAIDECPGSLASVGWERPPEDEAEAARLVGMLSEADTLRRASERRVGDKDGTLPRARP